MHNNTIGGEFFGYVDSKFVTINVGIDPQRRSIALYRGGWGLAYLISTVDNETTKIEILKRGWLKTRILLHVNGESYKLDTGNKFGDFLKTILVEYYE